MLVKLFLYRAIMFTCRCVYILNRHELVSSNVSTLFHQRWQILLCCTDISALSDQRCRSLCEQLASVLTLPACRREVNQVTEWAHMPVHLPWSNPVFSAKHVNGQLLGLKVLYLSVPPRQFAVMLPGSALIRRPLSCLTCLKDDPSPPPRTCLPMSAHNKWGMDWQLWLRGGRWSGGRVEMCLRRCMKMSFRARFSPVAQGWLIHFNCLCIYWLETWTLFCFRE